MKDSHIKQKPSDVLHTLVAAYFHQDWTLDFFTWQEVIHDYVDHHSSEDVLALYTEIKSLIDLPNGISGMEEYFDRELGHLFLERTDFSSYQDWFLAVTEILKTNLLQEKAIEK